MFQQGAAPRRRSKRDLYLLAEAFYAVQIIARQCCRRRSDQSKTAQKHQENDDCASSNSFYPEILPKTLPKRLAHSRPIRLLAAVLSHHLLPYFGLAHLRH